MRGLYLNFNKQALKNLDALKERVGDETREELVARALALLDITEEHHRAGMKIQFVGNGRVVDVSGIF